MRALHLIAWASTASAFSSPPIHCAIHDSQRLRAAPPIVGAPHIKRLKYTIGGGWGTTRTRVLRPDIHAAMPNGRSPSRKTPQRASVRLDISASAEPLWFVKTETFCKPFPIVKPHLEAHRAWVAGLRAAGTVMTSGYRVDSEGKPGGGGLMLFQATDYDAAEKLVRQDPLIANECVDWQLNEWIAEVGGLSLH